MVIEDMNGASFENISRALQDMCIPNTGAEENVLRILQNSKNTHRTAQDFLRAVGIFCGILRQGKITSDETAATAHALTSFSSNLAAVDAKKVEDALLAILRGSKGEEFSIAVKIVLAELRKAGEAYIPVTELAQVLGLGGAEIDIDRDAAALRHDYALLAPGAQQLFWRVLPEPSSSPKDDARTARIRSRIEGSNESAEDAWKDLVRYLSGKTSAAIKHSSEERSIFGPHTIEQIFDMMRDTAIPEDAIVEALHGQPKLRAEIKFRLINARLVMPDGFIPNIEDKYGRKGLKERQIAAVNNALKNPESPFNRAAWRIIVTIMRRSAKRFKPSSV